MSENDGKARELVALLGNDARATTLAGYIAAALAVAAEERDEEWRKAVTVVRADERHALDCLDYNACEASRPLRALLRGSTPMLPPMEKYAHSAECGGQPAGSGCICGVGFVAARGVEERDELRAALKAAEKDRDTWKRLCEKADAQATTATVRANKLANKRGYDIDDDAEERGRRSGVERIAQLEAALRNVDQQCAECFLACDECGHENSMADLDIRLTVKEALAPRDSAPQHKDWCALFGNPEAGKSCDCEPRDSGKEP